MSIDVTCGSCGKAYRVPDERAGQRFRCKQCQAVVDVPAQDDWGSPQQDLDAYGGMGAGYGAPNPYSAPVTVNPASGGKAAAAGRTAVCAIFIYVICGLSMLNHLYGLVMVATGQNVNPFVPPNQAAPANMQAAQMVGGIVGVVIGLTLDTLALVGAINLHKLKSYGMAMTGAIVCCIPCCGPCVILAIPFGIWALVLLNNPEIKRQFG
ncbi:MAG: hypothetical protein KDA96_04365 [Planctomycetaceae bacterium]|nr:hypothetical protein [Planctomycetaceae bacterium]